MQDAEKEIIAACQAGATERFGELYDAYVKKIYNFIYYKTHHKETAEDLVSETFRKALSHITTFDNSRSFSAWLYQIARNTVIDHYRTFHAVGNIDDVWDLAGTTDIERDADVKLRLDQISRYIKDLPAHQREIITLRLWESMSYKEIAEIVGKSENTCKMTFSRAIRDLRIALSKTLALFFLIKYFI